MASAAPAPTTPPGGTAQQGTASALGRALADCRTQWRLQSAALSDADRSLSQWRRHLAIMNDLQAHRISLATAKAEWPATTAKAPDNVAVFRSADRALAASGARCSVDGSTTGPVADAIRRCGGSMRTVGSALAAARVAIAPWEKHLTDQSHFKTGGMTPAGAEAAWRVMWKKGLATLPGYDAVAGGAKAAECTLPR
jgi:hypothetical protein